MDLGLTGRRALVCASSRGLGRACARALALEGACVVINGRDPDRLDRTAAELVAGTGGRIEQVVADVSDPAGRAALLAACPEPDVLVTNNGGPAPGAYQDWDHDTWIAAIEANMLAPILLIQAVLPGMRQRHFGRIVNITSAMVKAPRAHMGLSSAARTGLTGFAKAVSRDVARDGVTINNLLPERFDTDRQRDMAERIAATDGVSYQEARRRIAATIAAGRLGQPEEFGAACAFLCGEQAGFISGQNLQLDGGSYPALI